MIQRNVALAILLMDRIALAHEVEDGTVSLDKRSLDLAVLVRETIADLGYTKGADGMFRDGAGEPLSVEIGFVN